MIVKAQPQETVTDLLEAAENEDLLFSQVFQNQLSRMVQSHQLRLPRWYLW